jgi:RNA polymerase subunit RPABC4/transcription elongation factor Spt4
MAMSDPAAIRSILAGMRTFTRVDKKQLEHRGHTPGDNSACPVCGDHDHTDIRDAGLLGELPVPMYYLTCPICGDPDLPLASWTPPAIELMRARRASLAADDAG